ncbi:MAG: formate dehydrogenase accessory protein FdhE [Firmicutes bacterium]|nr:formate dehydrogenase accessory protein FdhE [Bacillota bacterium]
MEKYNQAESKLANFYMELVEIEEKVSSMEWDAEITDKIIELWQQGEPLLNHLQPKVTEELFNDVYTVVVRACLKWQPGLQNLSEDILSKLKEFDKVSIEALYSTIINDVERDKKEWAKRLSISIEMFNFLASSTSRILLSGFAAHAVTQLDMEKWKQGYCPICGGNPAMAKLSKEVGVRKLHCNGCETEWRFKRIGCPICNNDDSSKISFIMPEDQKQYRLYLCQQCKSYLKTVDERQCGEVDLFCEDLATADFDRLANSEGYRRGNQRYRA